MPECLLKFNAVPYIKGRYHVLKGLNVFIGFHKTRKKQSGYILAYKLTDDFEELFEKQVYWFKPDMNIMDDVFGNSVPDMNIIIDVNDLHNIQPGSVVIIDSSKIKQSEKTKIFKLAQEKNLQVIVISLSKSPKKFFKDNYVEFIIHKDSPAPVIGEIRYTVEGKSAVIL